MAFGLRFLFRRYRLGDLLAWRRLCWLVLIMAVCGFARDRTEVCWLGGDGAGCRLGSACATGSP